MAKKRKTIPQYGTVMLNGVEYYRTRICDADGKRVAIYILAASFLLISFSIAILHSMNSVVRYLGLFSNKIVLQLPCNSYGNRITLIICSIPLFANMPLQRSCNIQFPALTRTCQYFFHCCRRNLNELTSSFLPQSQISNANHFE